MHDLYHNLAQGLAKLFPAVCLICRRTVWSSIDICANCQKNLPQYNTFCLSCAHPLPIQQTRCVFCTTRAWRFERCVCLLSYRSPATELISAFKYRGHLAIGRSLGILLAQKILSTYKYEELPEVMLAMPLHASKLSERGFNQSVEITRTLSSYLPIKTTPNLVRRIRKTQSQVALSSSARLKNTHGAFALHHPCTYSSIALVDDVLTSGASAMALARCLPRTTRLHLWCLARAV